MPGVFPADEDAMRAALVTLITLAVGAPSPGQVRLGQRMEEGITDYEPSRLGLRVIHPDIREDIAFDHIYRVEGHDDLFARRHGGITAVFPRSVYYRTTKGAEYTVIPSGTVFYIGDAREIPMPGPPEPAPRPPRATLAEPLTAPDSGRLELATPAQTLAVRAAEAEAAPAEEETKPDAPARSRTMSDETYRRTRLKELASRLGPGPDAE